MKDKTGNRQIVVVQIDNLNGLKKGWYQPNVPVTIQNHLRTFEKLFVTLGL